MHVTLAQQLSPHTAKAQDRAAAGARFEENGRPERTSVKQHS
jgi:hypothetical protein